MDCGDVDIKQSRGMSVVFSNRIGHDSIGGKELCEKVTISTHVHMPFWIASFGAVHSKPIKHNIQSDRTIEALLI